MITIIVFMKKGKLLTYKGDTMLKKKKLKKYKSLIIIAIIFLLFLGIAFITTQNKNYSKLEKIIRDIGVKIESIFIPMTEDYSNNLIEGINQELEEENQELKKMLELEVEEYHLIHANVIKREIDWYQEITINKGEKDGIKLDMAVISNQGLIGRISKTGYTSSTVKLLTSNSTDMKIAVDIKNDQESIHGIIDGYLESESLVQVNNISKNSQINIEDKVYTNGLGGIYPSGIYIGKVVEITYDSLGLNRIIKIKPDTSYDTIRYVSVVDRGV